MTTTCLHDRDAEPTTPEQVGLAIEAAAARVGASRSRLTKPRRRVLELLLTASRPLKAYDLVARFHPDRRVAMPATVYRALEFLESAGLIHRLSTLKSYVACDRAFHAHAAAFPICECCGASREISPPATLSLGAAAAALGYSIDRVTVEASGRCAACRPAERQATAPG